MLHSALGREVSLSNGQHWIQSLKAVQSAENKWLLSVQPNMGHLYQTLLHGLESIQEEEVERM